MLLAAAFHRTRMALIAGPYSTLVEAERVLPAAQEWAVRAGGDPLAADYVYAAHEAWNGHARSLLGEWEPPPAGGPAPFDGYEIGPRRQAVPSDAEVWTLYGRVPDAGVEAVGYFATWEAAEEVRARITAGPYGG